MKKTILFLGFLSLFFLFSSKTQAAQLNVECGSTGCISSGVDPLFSESLDGVWYPGRTLEKTIEVKNTDSSQKQIRMKIRGSSSDELSEVMNIEFSRNSSIWDGSLRNFFGQEISLGAFNPLETREFSISASMEPDAGSFYQGKTANFDLLMGFWQEEGTVGQGGQGTDTNSEDSPQGMIAGAKSFISDFLRVPDETNFSGNKSQDEVLGSKALYSSCPCSVWCYLLGILTAFLLLIPLCVFRKKIKKYLNKLRGIKLRYKK